MESFRLTRMKYAGSLSGRGASLYPGRWNLVGQEVIYTATSRSLALVEILVHLPRKLIPRDFILQTIRIPSNLSILNVRMDELPPQWQQIPPGPESQRFGSSLIADHLLVMMPSAIVPEERNLLINPLLPGFPQIQLIREEPFPVDQRLYAPQELY
ncbi:MAG: RES family NAD+ phosphorylase [Saprospiraceae bacterium]|nr:RES family NAD+ phosphorylase [Saprospiraceae bacterium]